MLWRRSPFSALFTLVFALCSSAQLYNGQYFTSGLAISDAPAPDSQFTAGGTIAIAVDVSGDGKLPLANSLSNSTSPTAYISLNIFLTNADTNTTIVDDPSFLQGEPGSTVKHLNYVVPDCLKPGNYNLTYYEVSRVNGQQYFIITPIPLTLLNPNFPPAQSTSCPANTTTTALPLPQQDSPLPESPWLQGYTTTITQTFNTPEITQAPGGLTTITVFSTTTLTSTFVPFTTPIQLVPINSSPPTLTLSSHFNFILLFILLPVYAGFWIV